MGFGYRLYPSYVISYAHKQTNRKTVIYRIVNDIDLVVFHLGFHHVFERYSNSAFKGRVHAELHASHVSSVLFLRGLFRYVRA